MRSFRYIAQNEKGKRISGRMDAADELELAARLKQNSLMLISFKSRSSGASSSAATTDIACRAFSGPSATSAFTTSMSSPSVLRI